MFAADSAGTIDLTVEAHLIFVGSIMGQIKKKSEKRLKKEDYWKKLWTLTDTYKKALLVDVDNVSSQQLN